MLLAALLAIQISRPGHVRVPQPRVQLALAARIYNFPKSNRESSSKVYRCGLLYEASLNRLWFRDWTHNSTDGSFNAIYRFDWQMQRPVLIFDFVSNFDFQPARDIFAVVDRRGLAHYSGKKTVWVAKPWVGNWKTGKKWNVLFGMVYAKAIAIRPVSTR